MKNRLQFRLHDTLYNNRNEAIEYIKKTFAKDINGIPSLKGEPLLAFYGEDQDKANIILAIGRSGDGVNTLQNADYFIIDFAEHTEIINAINGNIEDTNNEIKDVIDTIENTKQDLIIRINNESDRATKSEEDLLIRILRLDERLTVEEGNSISLGNAIKEETNRATTREDKLNEQISSEVERANEAEQILQTNIDKSFSDLTSKIDNEITRSSNKDNEFESKFNEALNVEREHTEQITALNVLVKENQDDIIKNKVSSNDKTITVTQNSNGTDISVNIDGNTIIKNDGKLSVSNGLFSYLRLQLTDDERLLLVGNDDAIISEVNVSKLIADGMIESVEVKDDKIIFTFNTAAGNKPISIGFNELLTIYTADNGINIKDSLISINLSDKSEDYLKLDGSGLYIKGINDAIEARAALLANDIQNNQRNIDEVKTDLVSAEDKLRTEYKEADAAISTSLKSEVTSALESQEKELLGKIDQNTSDITTLKGDVNKDGSIKNIIYNSVIGSVETNILPDNAQDQSLLKKINNNGIPQIYASNNTKDMMHTDKDGKTDILKNILNSLIETNSQQQDNIDVLQNTIVDLTASIDALRTDLKNALSEIENLKNNAIMEIKGTDQQIAVIPGDNNDVTIKFADDAVFEASSN